MHDMYGYFETVVEYYTGRDASQMSDNALIMKLAHIKRIRMMEAKGSNNFK